MSRATTLLVTRDGAVAATIRPLIESIRYLRLKIVTTSAEAIHELQSPGTALVLAHLTRKDEAGETIGLLQASAAAGRCTPVIVLSDIHQPEQTLALLRQGAADCLDRPLDLHRLGYLIDSLTVRSRYLAQMAASEASTVAALGKSKLFYYTPSLERLMELVKRVAPQDTTILISGETGTGKTHLAKLIHELSSRSSDPFLTVNCAALPINLMESEMFGHVKGAFTGADRDRVGKFSEVGRGTLLLDEIDALPLELQAKFLRVVEERTYEPVGSNRSESAQARLIVASNRDLDTEVLAGRFRSDLFYRLNVVGFHLPPLRERREVIRPLATRVLSEFAARNDRPVSTITEEALFALEDYSWPGNIRELRNVIERAVALCGGPEIVMDDLSESVQKGVNGTPVDQSSPWAPVSADAANGTLAKTKEEAEAARIAQALERNDNNRLRTAAELGISRMTLYKKLHRYGLMGIEAS